MYYKKNKKKPQDICNICGKLAKMTWEHVPPQCCDNIGFVKINKIFNIENVNLKLDSQNGMKYRTLCDNCNNVILGGKPDQAFKDFYNQTKTFLANAKSINDVGIIEIDLVSVIKCLFGKFLAMDETYSEDKISKSMREFILNNKINDNVHVYFRLYPYNTIIQTRTHTTRQVCGQKYSTSGVISLLYFYPFAFVVSSEKEDLGMADLIDYIDFNKPFIRLKISPITACNPYTKKTLPYDWLINTKDSIIIAGSGFVDNIGIKKQN